MTIFFQRLLFSCNVHYLILVRFDLCRFGNGHCVFLFFFSFSFFFFNWIFYFENWFICQFYQVLNLIYRITVQIVAICFHFFFMKLIWYCKFIDICYWDGVCVCVFSRALNWEGHYLLLLLIILSFLLHIFYSFYYWNVCAGVG